MASNVNSDILELLRNNTQYQAAKYGQGGLVDLFINSYQAAFPKAPAANILAGGRHAWNIGQYNKAVRDAQQKAAQDAEDQNFALTEGYINAGGQPVMRNGLPVLLNKDTAKALSDMTGNQQFVQGTARRARGQDPAFGGLAPADQVRQYYEADMLKPFRETQERQDFYRRMQQGNPYGVQGLGAIQNPSIPQLEADPGAGSFTTGANFNAPQSPMSMALEGNYLADPTQIIQALAQQETARNNTAVNTREDSKLKMAEKELQLKQQGDYFKKYPPTGPAPQQASQTTVLMGLARQMGLNPAQTMQLLTDPKGFFGTGSKPAIKAMSPKQQEHMQKLWNKVLTTGGQAQRDALNAYNQFARPFGTKAQFKTGQQAPRNVGAQYGVQY